MLIQRSIDISASLSDPLFVSNSFDTTQSTALINSID